MSNRICIQRCEFVDYPDRHVSYGFRAYDNYDQTYLNTAPFELMVVEPLEFLAWLVKNVGDESLGAMLDFVREQESGIDIDDTWHEWEAIRPVLADNVPAETGRSGEQKDNTASQIPPREQS